MLQIPQIVTQNVAIDLASASLQNWMIFLCGSVSTPSAQSICMQLSYLDHKYKKLSENDKKNTEASIIIHSGGGCIQSGLAIYDVMRSLTIPVRTVVLGSAYSMGSFLLAAGDAGRRFAYPNSRIMVHEPLIQFSSSESFTATSLTTQSEELEHAKKQLAKLYLKHCNNKMTESKLNELFLKDSFLSPEDCLELGLIDQIISHKK